MRQFIYFFITLFTTFTTVFALPITTNAYRQTIAQHYHLRSSKHFLLLMIKGYQQTEDYTCGPATVMSLMNYYGMLKDSEMNKTTELNIAKEMGTTKDSGTSPQQMVTWLKQHGFDVISGENGTLELIQNNLKKGIPTLIEWSDWGGHWDAVAGYNTIGKSYNDDKDTIFFANPAAHYEDANDHFINGLTSFNPDRFSSMWFDAQYFKPGQIVRGIYIIAVPKKPSVNH